MFDTMLATLRRHAAIVDSAMLTRRDADARAFQRSICATLRRHFSSFFYAAMMLFRRHIFRHCRLRCRAAFCHAALLTLCAIN